MKPSLFVAFLLISLACLAALSKAHRDITYTEWCGKDFNNQSCGEPYPCCGRRRHCGNTVAECELENGCQPDFGICWGYTPPPSPPPPPPPSPPPPPTPSPPPSPTYNEWCGKDFNNQSCSEPTPCCGRRRHCGNTIAECGRENGCQPEFGICWDPSPPPPPPPPPTPSPPPSPIYHEWCGKGFNNQSCSEPTPCCGKRRHCGNTIAECGRENGCQPEFGICWDPSPPPPPPPTPSPPPSPIYHEWCGKGFNNQSCSEPTPCCGKRRHCGNTIAECGRENGCQPEFGICWDNTPPPPSQSNYERLCGPTHNNKHCAEPYPCCNVQGHCVKAGINCIITNCQPEFGTCWNDASLPHSKGDASLIGQVFGELELINRF